jgi:Catalytic LigB subunit of aromatic ring-opening dioxygenase
MSKLVGAYAMSHTPFCYMPPENWNAIRATRALRADVPLDDLAGNTEKFNRIQKAFETLRTKLAEANPDVVIIIGDDQMECYDFKNYPSFALYVGEEFEGFVSSPAALAHDAFQSVGVTPPPEAAELIKGAGPPKRAHLRGHPELGSALLTGLVRRGFDPAFSMEMTKPDFGLGHAFMRPSETLTDMKTPILPVLTNCYFAPQITGKRSWQMGEAIRESIEEHTGDLRVAIIGSGGLWHTPARKDAYLDEEFDRAQLDFMAKGDIEGMAKHFDGYTPPSGDPSQAAQPRGAASTGMPLSDGPQGGTRETANWIAAAAVAGKPATVVDYVPVYSSPIGCGFAYWDGF